MLGSREQTRPRRCGGGAPMTPVSADRNRAPAARPLREPRLLRGSYRPDDVTLLLTDLTGRVAPQPMADVARLARRTAGRGHRGVVPVEDPPTAAPRALLEGRRAAGAGRWRCCRACSRAVSPTPTPARSWSS